MTARPAPITRISRHLRPFPRRGMLLACLAGTVLSASSPWVRTAIADPRGAHVVTGNVNIAQNGNKTVIRASNGSIINYDSFNIGAGEIVRFIQPSAQSRVLNRITGNQPTLIQGSLFANGRVFFINTAGITFSSTAVVSTGGIVAAATNISDADFAAGRLHVTGGMQGGTVRNDGVISAQMVSLVGKQVINTGTINAPSGWVVMAAGDDVFIGESGRHVVVRADLPQGQSQTQGAAVEQSGTINARGGRVDFASGDLYSTALRIAGVTTAQKVRAVASGQGSVEVTGSIDASNQGENNTGGRVHILGHDVTLDHASIDATGTNGGGEIRIGGDLAGGAGLPSADTTIVRNGTTLDASATGAGRGGSIVVWSDNLTRFEGTALADSTLSFSGGLVETSSAGTLNVARSIIRSRNGTWLLDPAGDLVIDTTDPADGSSFVDVATLNAALDMGGTVNSVMAIPLTATGDIFIRSSILKSMGGDATLILNSAHGIDLATGVTISNTSGSGGLDLSLSWGSGGTGTLTVNSGAFSSSAFSNLGTVTYDLAGNLFIQSTATAAGQIAAQSMIGDLLDAGTNVQVLSTGGITVNQAFNMGGSALTLTANSNITLNSGITMTGAQAGAINLNAGIDIILSAGISLTGAQNSSATLLAAHDITIGASGGVAGSGSGAGRLDATLSWGHLMNGSGFVSKLTGLNSLTYAFNTDVTIGSGTIVDASSMVSAFLDAGRSLTVTADGSHSITVSSAISKSTPGGGDCTLTLRAGGDVSFTGSGSVTSSGATAGKINLNVFADTPVTGSSDGVGNAAFGTVLTLNGGDLHVMGHSLVITPPGAVTGAGLVSLLLDGGADAITTFSANSFEVGGRTGTLTLAANFNANTSASNGAFTFLTAVNAAGHDITINTGSGKISFLGAVSGANNLTLTSTNAAADALSVLDITGSSGFQHFFGNTTLDGTYTITSGAAADFTVTGSTTLAADTSITNTVGVDGSMRGIHFTGSIDSASATNNSLTLNAGAHRIGLDGGAGTTQQLSRMVATGSLITCGLGVKTVGDGSMNPSQLYTGDVSLLGTFSTANTGFQIDGNAVLSGASVIVNTGSGTLTINGGVTGSGADLSLRSSALAKVTGNISGVNALSTDTAGTGAGTTELDGTVSAASITFNDAADLRGATITSTTGSQTYNGSVTNGGSGDISFTASTSGQKISFLDDVNGGSHGITTTTSGAAGATEFAGGHTVSGGFVTVNNNLTLTGASSALIATIDTSAAGGDINLGAVNGAPSLSLDAGAGQVVLHGAIGATTPIGAIGATGASIALQSVATTGSQSYHGPITLSGATVTLSSSLGSQIAFDSTITGTTTSLIVNTSGNTGFGDDVSLGTGGLTTDAMGTTTLAAAGGGFIVTAGPISIQDNLILTSGAYSFLSFGGSSAANRGQTFGGTITAISAGASLLLDAGNLGSPLSAANRGNVTVTGAIGATGASLGNLQIFGNVVTLHAATTAAGSQDISGDDVTLNGAYDSGSSAFSVTGTTAIRLGSNATVTTTNNATFSGPLLLQAHDLAVNADGATRFTGAISGAGALSTNAAGTSRFDSTIDVASLSILDNATLFGATATTSGNMTFGGSLTMENDITLASTAGDISMMGLVDGLGIVNAVNHSLTLNVASGHFSLIDATATHLNQLLSSATGKVQIRQSAAPTISANLVTLSGGLELLGTAA
ncbi:MAG TPA: filamentous hemagglutinin N-terminal domain-containing protein, partial [Phycisphaerales bacterium]|nr:filamentous hemagglutinin N-terminal domain-containing protein [Phycisphaerales bacterium]